MIIIKSPFRLSFFGGSSDYKEFYEKNGSFLIGTTIDKYCYISIRRRPSIMPKKSVVSYSKFEEITSFDEISNPLIRETFKYFKVNFNVECNSFADIPGRTGLGGSSSYCVGLCLAIRKLLGLDTRKKTIADDAINIERVILKESGGIQDQIWAAYGGLNSIEITTDGKYLVKPMPVTSDFISELEKSISLIYVGGQRFSDEIAKSHENKNKTQILNLAKIAYDRFLKEDIVGIGSLLYESWKEKEKLSNLITNEEISRRIKEVMSYGAYGAKLIGSGGCGFIITICDPKTNNYIKSVFKNEILDFKFDSKGATEIYSQDE
jgi:D-glycero-alpha-D-manno-heptose-7-phosphate kinase